VDASVIAVVVAIPAASSVAVLPCLFDGSRMNEYEKSRNI
jgi:hypothetical protein